MKIYPNKANA